MKQPLLALLALLSIVGGAFLVVQFTPAPAPTHVVHLIPPAYHASAYIAPASGGGMIRVPGYFTRALSHHRWCGAPTSQAKRGIHGVFRQHFRQCLLSIGPVIVSAYPAAAHPTPTNAPPATPTTVPTIQVLYPTVIPTAPAAMPSDPVQYLLALMNRARAQVGLPAYSLNITESNGTSTCVGSYGHTLHESQVGYISHDQFGTGPGQDICVSVRAAGENTGEASGYSVLGALDIINQQMLAEPIGPGIQNHHTNIVSATFREVGIGVVTVSGTTFMTVDFLTP